jgi:ABC-type glycerol-3-phosphate transport system substrate-binding protein
MLMTTGSVSRRKFLATSALATSALIAAPHVRGAHAAGKLSIGFWDHWVPGANDTMTKLCKEWGEKEKVEVTMDYITSIGEKNMLTIAAEAQAKAGHDILQHPAWFPADYAEQLEPMDDLMAKLIADNGAVAKHAEYLGKQKGHWVAIPATTGSQVKNPCARIDLFKQHVGLDLQKMYPAGAEPDPELQKKWTWDTFLDAAEKCHKAGFPFGMPLGQTTDAVDWVGSLFASYGSVLVDQEGQITVKSDATRQVLEWAKKLVQYLPPDVFAWDDASNNKWLISGKGALIHNPPSAWAVARRDAPQVAAQCWTFDNAAGPKGRFAPGLPYFLGLWNFSPNKASGKSLLAHLSQRSSVEQLVAASGGYDLPSFAKLRDFKTWETEGPPPGTLYNYPPKHDQIVSIAAAPAPPKIANQIYTQATMTKMIAHCTQGGETIEQAIAWAASELEGFMRT